MKWRTLKRGWRYWRRQWLRTVSYKQQGYRISPTGWITSAWDGRKCAGIFLRRDYRRHIRLRRRWHFSARDAFRDEGRSGNLLLLLWRFNSCLCRRWMEVLHCLHSNWRLNYFWWPSSLKSQNAPARWMIPLYRKVRDKIFKTCQRTFSWSGSGVHLRLPRKNCLGKTVES